MPLNQRPPFLAETKEGLELVFLMENPNRGAEEGQEEPDEQQLGTVGPCLLDRYRGTLERGESGGLLLHLRLGGKELG